MTAKRAMRRISYYARGIGRYFSPSCLFRSELIEAAALFKEPDVKDRVDYYCKLAADGENIFKPNGSLEQIKIIGQSRYALDLHNVTAGLDRNFAIDVAFGDVTFVPKHPAFVKSRPICETNHNSVVLPLDRLRHFNFPTDPLRLSEKEGSVVWRGTLNNPTRLAAVERFGARLDYNIGHTSENSDHPFLKSRLGIMDHYKYRYILSIEGNDVATNLKWIMASNSAAVCPPMRYETWFMEGRLIPDIHFVGVEHDLSNLDEKISWYEGRPDALSRIVTAAHRWVENFRNWDREEAIARAVVLKYAKLSGQYPIWLDD